MADFQIPSELEKRLFVSDKKLAKNLVAKLDKFADLLVGDKLEFFVEYTDHSIEHVNKVLENIEDLMAKDTLEKLNSLDLAILIVAVMLHDIGMKATIELFQNMLKGSYDYNQPGMPIEKNIYNDKSWVDLWEDYVKESQFWNEEKKINVIGESAYTVSGDDLRHKILEDPNELNGKDKRFIGEFIRRHHGRIAYEVAIRGYWGYNENRIVINDVLDEEYLQLAGMVARSHSMGLRENYNYLEKITDKTHYKSPYDIDIILHMALIRLSDYLHIDEGRTNKIILYLRKTYSPYSLKEHKKHLAITNINFKEKEETISITVKSKIESAELFVSIEQLIRDIQSEFDTCWAVLGAQYSDKYKLKYRRITSNLSQDGEFSVRNSQKYVPKQFGLRFNNKLFELLIAPLYGNNPNYGVRELVQNAVDACRTRLAVDPNYSETISHVRVDLDTEKKLFVIEDSGIGMTIDEIEKFFLTIGSSYDSSIEWHKTRDAEGIYRTGHFGIGILAAFLLGNRITVKTRSIKSEQGYMFTVSLQDSFIQINKIEKQNIGTIITVQCEDDSVEDLTKEVLISEIVEKNDESASDYWFNLYIDEVPRVCYYSDKVQITPHLNASRGFMKLNYQHDEFEVFWKPLSFYWEKGQNEIDKSPLYCNGFFITNSPSKGSFNLNFSSYLHNIQIPALIIKDKYNMLPLNLKRDNIDNNYTYSFEKELAYEFFKDLICRLCAINVEDFNRNYLCFTANGFAINQYPSFPFIDNNSESLIKNDLYTENFLSNKKIVIIICTEKDAINKININEFRKIIKGFPEYVFYFYEDRNIFNNHNTVFKYHINTWLLKQFNCIVVDRSHSNHLTFPRFIPPYKPNDNIRILKDYVFFNLKEEYSDLLASIRILFNNCNLSSPPYFLIKKNNKAPISSDVDDLFNKYASGDMVVPYDEVDRKIKFAKLYEECGEKIERYREAYKRQRKEGF